MTNLYTRARPSPASLDLESRTVQVVASSGAPVERHDHEGAFIESLLIEPGAVDLSRVASMSLLDGHEHNKVDGILGDVLDVRIESGQLIALLKISRNRDDLLADVRDGVVKNVSIGYRPIEWIDGHDTDGRRTRVLTRWQLYEISFVGVPADRDAKTRSEGMTKPTHQNSPVIVPVTPPTIEPVTVPEVRSNPAVSSAAPANEPATEPVIETRAEPQVQTAPQTMTRAEENQEIRAIAQTVGLPASWSDEQIDAGATVEQARSAATLSMFSAISQQPGLTPRIIQTGASGDDPAVVARRMAEATYASRVNPAHELPEECRDFVNMSLRDQASYCLSMRGVATTGLSSSDLFGRALTTSDFPILLQETGDRTLRAAYELAPATVKRVSRQSTAMDFRTKHKIQAEDIGELLPTNEHGEFQSGSFAEAKETYSLTTAGRIIQLSRQAMVNDDLGAFTDVLARFGLRAGEYENQTLVNLVLANADMADGNPVFDAAHGNLAASGAALSVASLSAARLAMRRQTSLNGLPISVAPKFLLVPPELETDAETLLATIQPATTGDVNPFGGKLELLVEPRFADPAAWYLAADPALVEGIEYSYLAGEEGPQTDTRVGFDVDGFEFKVRLDFGAAFIDHRGWYRNPGA